MDDQQPGSSRQLMFTLSPTKTVNPRFTSGLSSFFGGIPSVLQYQQINTPQPVSPLNFIQHCHQCHLPLIKNSQDLPASPASKVGPNEQISLHKSHQPALLRPTQIFQKKLLSCCCPKTKKAHHPTLTLPQKHKKIV